MTTKPTETRDDWPVWMPKPKIGARFTYHGVVHRLRGQQGAVTEVIGRTPGYVAVRFDSGELLGWTSVFGLIFDAPADPVRRDADRIADAIRDRDDVELTDAERAVLAQAVTEVQGGAR